MVEAKDDPLKIDFQELLDEWNIRAQRQGAEELFTTRLNRNWI